MYILPQLLKKKNPTALPKRNSEGEKSKYAIVSFLKKIFF